MAKDEATKKDTARQSALAKAQRAADKRLRADHPDTWNEYMAKAAAEVGIADWQPPVSAEEKALQQAQALFEKNPGLRERLLGAEAKADGAPGRQKPESGEIDLDLS